MAYKNPTELLVDATKFPATVEAKLPGGAPKLSTMLLDVAQQLPTVPDFPVEVPDLPAPPELPEPPEFPGGLGENALGMKFVRRAEVIQVGNAGKKVVIPSPAVGVLPEVISRRGM